MTADMNMNILVIDDYKAMLQIMENLLKQIGFKHIYQVTDGPAALKLLHELPFGLIISDWHMPPMNGLDLLKEVRADEKLKNIPFIMATAESKTESVTAAREAGVSNYLVKPFNAEMLKNKLVAVLGRI